MAESKRPAPKESTAAVTSDDIIFICEKCTDYHGERGISTLAVNEETRKEFYLTHPLIELELLKEAKNPSLEEGNFTSLTVRDRKGELFITYPVAASLVREHIIQHKDKPGGIPYNKDNIFTLKNDLEQLGTVLQALRLKPDEDAKIGFFFDIHEIEIYLRNIDGRMHVFVIDPLGFPKDGLEQQKNLLPLAQKITEVFDKPFLVFSTAELQMDYFSCSIDGHMILRFFAKHGAEIFPHIKKHGTTERLSADERFSYHLLAPEDLMPALFKVSLNHHYNKTLTDNLKKAIVSVRKKTTMQEYLDQSTIHIALNGVGGTEYYAQSLLKRYKFIAKADRILVRDLKNKFLQQRDEKDIPDAFKDMKKINLTELAKLLEQDVKPEFVMSFCKFLYQYSYPIFHRIAMHLQDETPLVNFAVKLKEHAAEFLSLKNSFGQAILSYLAKSPQTATIDSFAKLALPEEVAHKFFLLAVEMISASHKQNRLYLIKAALNYYHEKDPRETFINRLIQTYPESALNDAQKEEIQFLLKRFEGDEHRQIFFKLLTRAKLLSHSMKDRPCVSFEQIHAFLQEQKREEVRPLLDRDMLYSTHHLDEDMCKKLFSLYRKFYSNDEVIAMLFHEDLSHTRWIGWALGFRNAALVKEAIELCKENPRAHDFINNYVTERFLSHLERNENENIEFFFSNNLVKREMLSLAAKKQDLKRHPYFTARQHLLNSLLDETKALPQQSLLAAPASTRATQQNMSPTDPKNQRPIR